MDKERFNCRVARVVRFPITTSLLVSEGFSEGF
jgi:hypothetical protein